jgi:hypothetical protein
MCAAHKTGLLIGVKTSDLVKKKTMGFLKDATTSGSMKDAA